jgi:hypothetical protein
VSVRDLILDGDLSSDGGLPTDPGVSGGAGSGGSISITADTITGSGRIHANGGDASPDVASWAAGGGGRLSIAFGSNGLSPSAMTAHGGAFTGDASLAACLIGASGTTLLSTLTDDPTNPVFREIKVSGCFS